MARPTPRAHRPAVAFVTLGCPKNHVDSDKLAGLLESQGYGLATSAEEAAAAVELVKRLRARHKIPYLSPFYYG